MGNNESVGGRSLLLLVIENESVWGGRERETHTHSRCLSKGDNFPRIKRRGKKIHGTNFLSHYFSSPSLAAHKRAEGDWKRSKRVFERLMAPPLLSLSLIRYHWLDIWETGCGRRKRRRKGERKKLHSQGYHGCFPPSIPKLRTKHICSCWDAQTSHYVVR